MRAVHHEARRPQCALSGFFTVAWNEMSPLMFPLRPEAPAEATRPLLAPKQGRGHDISAKTAPSGAHPHPPPSHQSASQDDRPSPVPSSAGLRQVLGTGLMTGWTGSQPRSCSLRLGFLFSLFLSQFFSELLLPFSFLPGPLLILVKVKIILELCDFLHASHTTYDFQTERIPWVTQGRSRKDPPLSRPHGEGCLFSAHALSELLEERGTGLPCSPERSASPATWRGGPHRDPREAGAGARQEHFLLHLLLSQARAHSVRWCSPSRCSGAVLRAVTGEAEGTQTGDLMQTKGGG